MEFGHLPVALQPGMRVVVRYLVQSDGPATDALGVLLSRDEHHCTVETRRGPVTIELATIVAAKQVPPLPERRSRVPQTPLHD
ncbi:MAG: ferrous iron transport protein A [Nakamurella sp.]